MANPNFWTDHVNHKRSPSDLLITELVPGLVEDLATSPPKVVRAATMAGQTRACLSIIAKILESENSDPSSLLRLNAHLKKREDIEAWTVAAGLWLEGQNSGCVLAHQVVAAMEGEDDLIRVEAMAQL